MSRVRFGGSAGEWGPVTTVKSNHPAEFGGYWFFQSMWDRPEPSLRYGGMAHTGLGVGNREGVFVMLTGTLMMIVGMMYAFYVKPVLRRRRVRKEIRGPDAVGR